MDVVKAKLDPQVYSRQRVSSITVKSSVSLKSPPHTVLTLLALRRPSGTVRFPLEIPVPTTNPIPTGNIAFPAIDSAFQKLVLDRQSHSSHRSMKVNSTSITFPNSFPMNIPVANKISRRYLECSFPLHVAHLNLSPVKQIALGILKHHFLPLHIPHICIDLSDLCPGIWPNNVHLGGTCYR